MAVARSEIGVEQRRARAERFGSEWMTLDDFMREVPMTYGGFHEVRPYLRCRPNSDKARNTRGCGLLVHRDDVAAMVALKRIVRTSWCAAARMVDMRQQVIDALGGCDE